MKRKGLSQVLWLIIAAAVLMMVSMALTFTTQGTLGDFASNTNENACTTSLDNQLQASVEGDNFAIPNPCLSDDGNPVTSQLRNQGDTDSWETAEVCVEDDDAAYSQTRTWSVDDSC